MSTWTPITDAERAQIRALGELVEDAVITWPDDLAVAWFSARAVRIAADSRPHCAPAWLISPRATSAMGGRRDGDNF